jgi:tetratricopeptide (TPR) repeat protein
LYLQARVSLESGRRDQSVNLLKQALELASNAGYHRLISIASLEISRIYRQQGEVWKAVGSSEVGLQASREVGDYTEVISQIHNQGILQADQGRFVQADHLYGGAVRALNALLAKFTSAYARAYFVSRMSDLYSDYFSLALLKLKDPPKAFAILDRRAAGAFRILFEGGGRILTGRPMAPSEVLSRRSLPGRSRNSGTRKNPRSCAKR